MSVLMKGVVGVAVLAGGLVSMAGAQQKTSLPDAQVEANVLKALASAPELSTQNIQTTTVYGVVTLRGSANDEASRTKAENLAARAQGVVKVIDEMSVGATTAEQNPGADQNPGQGAGEPVQSANNGMVLQSDGTYAPAQPGDAAPPPAAGDRAAGQAQQSAAPEPGYVSPPAPPAGGQYPAQADGQNSQGNPQNGGGYPQAVGQYPPQADGQYPAQGNGQYPSRPNAQYPPQYPAQANGQYPPPPSSQYPPRRPMYGNAAGYPAVPGGQEAGRPVVVPSGSMLRIRINQGLSTHHAQPGSVFDGTVLNDVIADGAVAIPRGAAVQGTVVDVKDAGALKGRGELSLQLTRLTLGGQSYPLVSDTWKRDGADKSQRTVNSALGLGALGAIVGAVAGGGEGAAIGAGVGGAAGVASSAASEGGAVIIPPEAVLTFHLQQPTPVATVSEQEMTRLSYAAGPNPGPQPVVRRRYPDVYYAPYPPPYSPYSYPRY